MNLIFDSEGFPDFFAQAPILHIQDKLAWFLGAADSGLLQYRYADAVKLAGHSCPTVAAAYLMTLAGIKALYGEELAQRGEIEVFFAQSPDSGTTGVMASIVQLLTGAASDTGFAGIGAQALFKRRNLLQFNADIEAVMLMRRQDNGDAVSIALNTRIGGCAGAKLFCPIMAGTRISDVIASCRGLANDSAETMRFSRLR